VAANAPKPVSDVVRWEARIGAPGAQPVAEFLRREARVGRAIAETAAAKAQVPEFLVFEARDAVAAEAATPRPAPEFLAAEAAAFAAVEADPFAGQRRGLDSIETVAAPVPAFIQREATPVAFAGAAPRRQIPHFLEIEARLTPLMDEAPRAFADVRGLPRTSVPAFLGLEVRRATATPAPVPAFLALEARVGVQFAQAAPGAPFVVRAAEIRTAVPQFLQREAAPRALAATEPVPVPDFLKLEGQFQTAYLAADPVAPAVPAEPKVTAPTRLALAAIAKPAPQHLETAAPPPSPVVLAAERDDGVETLLAPTHSVEEGILAYLARDYRKALDTWLGLARRGIADSQFFVGGLYMDGEGVDRDFVRAHAWWTLAEDQGHAKAGQLLSQLRYMMNQEEIARAERMARSI
jgi:hypothetical protein